MLKRIFINVLLLLFLFGMVELYSYQQTKKLNIVLKAKADRVEANKTRKFVTQYKVMDDFNTTVWRNSFYKEKSEKKPIILFGCSFAEGAGLEDEHTPCYKISELTGRSCINRSKGATGTQFMYYQLNNPEFFNKAPEADYVIYVFIWNHLQRLYNFQVNALINMFNLRYKIENHKLVEIKPVFKPLYSLYLVKRFLNNRAYKMADEEKYNFSLFNKVMSESVRITQEKYPDSKFIMLEFPETDQNFLPAYELARLKAMGIEVVRVTDLVKDIDINDKKYWLSDDIHPSEELWDIVMPRFVNKYLSE